MSEKNTNKVANILKAIQTDSTLRDAVREMFTEEIKAQRELTRSAKTDQKLKDIRKKFGIQKLSVSPEEIGVGWSDTEKWFTGITRSAFAYGSTKAWSEANPLKAEQSKGIKGSGLYIIDNDVYYVRHKMNGTKVAYALTQGARDRLMAKVQ